MDEDSLFRAIISELGENSGTKTEIEKQVSAWLKFYDSVVKKPNSTEDVVRIGALEPVLNYVSLPPY